MAEHRNSLAFRVETAAEILILQIVILQDLDSHQPVQPVTTGLIHHSHTAGTDDFQDLISIIQQTAYVFILIHLGSTPFSQSHKHTGHIVRRAPLFGNLQQLFTAAFPLLAVSYFK